MTELDTRLDELDVESILARVEKKRLSPFTFSRNRCIYQAPEFTQRLPAHETVEEGSSVSFGCKVLGFPKPTVTWYKDDDVIGPDGRAALTTDGNGIHTMKIQDVSKCDAGNYKVNASNLEGSSSSSLCITVKAKSKTRNRKKKKTRAVACAPLFPAIVEHEAEERRETIATEEQDESPLTPLYSNISRRSPVTWPAFLGDWAYQNDENSHHDIGDLEIECEDVFDGTGSEHSVQPSLTFVSTNYAAQTLTDKLNNVNMMNSVDNNQEGGTVEKSEQKCHKADNINETSGELSNSKDGDTSNQVTNTKVPNGNIPSAHVSSRKTGDIKPPSSLDLPNVLSAKSKDLSINDVLNNNKKFDESLMTTVKEPLEVMNGNFVPPVQLKDEVLRYEPKEIEQIVVNRSYAKGNASKTFSVATRSNSPYRTVRNQSKVQQNKPNSRTDTSTLQNLNNERLLLRMKQSGQWSRGILSAITWPGSAEDSIAEVILLICAGTFVALWFDLSPSTFVLDVIIAFIVKLVLTVVFKNV